MRVVALLVNYRDANGVAAAAASVLNDAPDTEVIVVDNSDDIHEWQKLIDAIPQGVRTVRASGNVGFGQGCNQAMQYTDAPLVMLVNPDVRLHAGCVAALRDVLVVDPSIAAVSPRQFLDTACDWMLPESWLPTALGTWVTERVMRNQQLQLRWACATHARSLRYWTTSTLLQQRALSGGAMMIRRTAIEPQQPLFDPRFFMYFEDSDLCLRLRKRGWKLALVPWAHATHAWRNAAHKAALMQTAMSVYFDKHYPLINGWQARRAILQMQPSESCWRASSNALEGSNLRVECEASALWCIEVSPHAWLTPAVARLGRGCAYVDLMSTLDAVAGSSSIAYVRWSRMDDHSLCRALNWHWNAS